MDPFFTAFQMVFSEKGIIGGLFVFAFLVFVWKGIPFAIKQYQTLLTTHATMQSDLLKAHEESQRRQQTLFENSIDKVTTTFMEAFQSTKEWNEHHSKEL